MALAGGPTGPAIGRIPLSVQQAGQDVRLTFSAGHERTEPAWAILALKVMRAIGLDMFGRGDREGDGRVRRGRGCPGKPT